LATPGSAGPLIVTSLYEELEKLCENVDPSLVVLDTLADLFGGDENNRSHARQFIGKLRHIAIEQRCAVVLLSHPSLSGTASGSGLSGSTAWDGSVRARLYMERVDECEHRRDPDRRRISLKKSNYGRLDQEFYVRYHKGSFVRESHVVDALDRTLWAEQVFLSLLGQYSEQGRDVRPNPGSGYAPHVFANDPQAQGITKKAFSDAMNRLFATGRIAVERVGPASKTTQRLVRSPLREGAK
jgi:RecA-family ATPase